jgi:dTDP-4-amino-4,6-dideoxygalactose transaminase
MSAPLRLALDGGPPCLATTTVARWPSSGVDDALFALGPLTGALSGQGPTLAVRRLERRWGDVTHRQHVVACRSGTAAARLAAASLDLGPGDEIICPVDAIASATALARVSQAVPVYVDLDPQTLHLDPAAVSAAISGRTRAILAVDSHGVPADYRPLEAMARRYGLAVLEDGSQALGATYHRRPVGSLGVASFCSLGDHAIKGARVAGAFYATDDATQAANARRLLLVNDDFGLHSPLAGTGPGPSWSYRISEVDARLADSCLTRLDYAVAVRRANGRHLRRRLAELAGIWMPDPTPGASAVYSAFPLLVQPDELGLPETAATALRDTLIDCTTAEGLWIDRSQPQTMSTLAGDEARTWEGEPVSLAAPRRTDYPVADAMWASGLVLGQGPDRRLLLQDPRRQRGPAVPAHPRPDGHHTVTSALAPPTVLPRSAERAQSSA